MEMVIFERNDNITHIALTGRLDASAVEEIGNRFSDATATKQRSAIIDMAGIDFMASLGIALLFSNCKRLKAAGKKLVLLNPQKMVEEVLLTSKVDKVMPIAFGLDEAIQIVLGGPAKTGTVDSQRKSTDESRIQRQMSVAGDSSAIKDELKLSVKNEISELETLNAALSQFLTTHNVPTRAAYAVNLAVEELFVNVIRYAYVDDDSHVINFTLAVTSEQLIMRIVDDGRAFDPREGPELNLHAEDREVGGLGLILVLDMVDTLKYRRVDGTNQVEVRIGLIADTQPDLSDAASDLLDAK